MSVGRVEHQNVGSGFKQLLGAGFAVLANADGSADTQASGGVLAGIGVLLHFVDVFHGDKAAQMAFFINNKQFFNAVLVQMLLGFFKRSAHRHGNELLAGHDVGHAHSVSVFNEANVTVGENAHQTAIRHNGQARNAEVRHKVKGFLHRIVG